MRALTVDGLLKNDEIDAVVNLTVPDVHYQVTQAILSAGKHAYTREAAGAQCEGRERSSSPRPTSAG